MDSLPCTAMSSLLHAAQLSTVATSAGPARVHGEAGTAGLLVLGHGAGGGVEALDLLAARDAARSLGWSVVRVEQPWRVAGRRIAAPPPRLDAAWSEVLAGLPRPDGPLVLGGRSAGARVACRSAAAAGADGVLALAFPLVPPGTSRTRQAELDLVATPVLVVQGGRDAFGCPAEAPGRVVVVVPGADHGFVVRRKDGRSAQEVSLQIEQVVRGWLQALT